LQERTVLMAGRILMCSYVENLSTRTNAMCQKALYRMDRAECT
jgi:hypothetical protein